MNAASSFEDGNLFAYQMAYQYPTYQHEERWWDRITFWEHRIHEMPDFPAGLKEVNRRTTYDETDE